MHKKELSVLLVVGLFALAVLIIMMLPGVPKAPPGRATFDEARAECTGTRDCILYEASIPPASIITEPDGTVVQSMSSWDTFSCLKQNTFTSDGGFFCEAGRVISCGKSPTRIAHADDRAFHCRYLNIFTGIPPGSPGTSVSEGITTWYCDQYGQFTYDAQGVPIWFNVDKKPGKWTLTKPPSWDVDCGYVCKADSTRCEGNRQVVSLPGGPTGGQSAGNWGQNQVVRGTTLQTCNSRGSAYADTVCSGMCLETMPHSVPPEYQGQYEWQARQECMNDKCPPVQGTMTEPEFEAAMDVCQSYCDNPDLYKSTYVQGNASCVACIADSDCGTGSCVNGACGGAVPPPVLVPGISLTKTVSATNYSANYTGGGSGYPVGGSEVTYTFVITSTGDDTAYNVTLADVYPPGFMYVESSHLPDIVGENYSYYGIFFLGNLTPNSSITVTVIMDATTNGTFNNTAYALYSAANGTTYGGAYSSSSVSSTAWVTVGAAPPPPVPPATYANTSVTKTASVNGSIITYTIVLSSTGTEPAVNVTVKETYASGLVFLSSVPNTSSGNDTWFFGSLAVNSSTVITVTLNATVNGTFSNSVSVTSYAGSSGVPAPSATTISTLVGPAPVPPPVPTPSGGGGGGGGGGGSRGGVLCPTYCVKDPKYSDPNYPGYVYIPICSSNACLAMSKVVQPSPPIATPAPSREIAKCGDSNKMYPEYCDPAGSACKDREGLDGTCAADCMSCVATPAQVVEVAPPEIPVVEAPEVQPKVAAKAKSSGWLVGVPIAVLIIAGVAYYYIRRRLLGMPL